MLSIIILLHSEIAAIIPRQVLVFASLNRFALTKAGQYQKEIGTRFIHF